jgi:hypothetical protein
MDREKELQRLYDIAWNVGAMGEQIREEKKLPELKVDAVLHGLERTPENVSMIYKFIASATELSASTRQELSWGILAPYLQRVWSKEAVDDFKKKYPLRDKANPDFIDVVELQGRMERSGLVTKEMPQWTDQFATKVLNEALGEIEISKENVQQLYYAICNHWKYQLNGVDRTDLGDPSVLPRSLQLVHICILKLTNSQNFKLEEPAEFGTIEILLM